MTDLRKGMELGADDYLMLKKTKELPTRGVRRRRLLDWFECSTALVG
jgi:hypothetical protein